MEIVTKSSRETFNLGKKIGSSLKGGEILAFFGGLGAGKTTFIQGLAEGMGIKAKITSPTFILMRKYEGNFDFYHMDLYRLEENVEKEVVNLGLFDLLNNPKNIIAIEWAEKMEKALPKNAQLIQIENLNETERKITLNE
jgi:tRNA threonylcarbamoyladenosine biosynthesis protein TsaE